MAISNQSPASLAALPALQEALQAAGWRQRELSGFASRFGPLWTRKTEQGWHYGVLPTAEHLNPAGSVHGGVIASLLDHAVSAWAWEQMQRRPCVTVQLDTQFMQAAREGLLLEARGEVSHATQSLVFMQGRVFQGEACVAQASAVLKALR